METYLPKLNNFSRASIAATSLLLVVGLILPAAAAPPAMEVNLVWHDDELWNTVVVGPIRGKAPVHTLDAFYAFPDVQKPVAGAGPGDSDYNGGRWQPFVCTGGGAYTDGDQVEAAIVAGDITCTANDPNGPAGGANFLCPLTNRNA